MSNKAELTEEVNYLFSTTLFATDEKTRMIVSTTELTNLLSETYGINPAIVKIALESDSYFFNTECRGFGIQKQTSN